MSIDTPDVPVASDVLAKALDGLACGLAMIRAAKDGTKRPEGAWKEWQTRKPPVELVTQWFGNGWQGLGVVTGKVSNDLEMFELEGRAVQEGLHEQLFDRAVAAGIGDLVLRISAGYSERTPTGGLHILYRVTGGVGPSVRLARRPATAAELERDPDAKTKVLIETRAEGGFAVVSPSHGKTHPTGGAWEMIEGGVETIVTISAEDRDRLHAAAGTFDQIEAIDAVSWPVGERSPARAAIGGESTPSEEFMDAHRAGDVLTRAGFTASGQQGGGTSYVRPGKAAKDGLSAIVVDCHQRTGDERATLYSTSIDVPAEFIAPRALDAWQLHVALNHGGDFSGAGRDWRLAHPRPRKTDAELVAWIPLAGNGNSSGATVAEAAPDSLVEGTGAGSGVDGGQGDRGAPVLPDEFWEARPALTHIRQAAWARLIAPDALIGATLAAVSQHTDHRFVLPPIVCRVGSSNLLVAIVALSGGGKGSTCDEARDLVAAHVAVTGFAVGEKGAGSGEGMIKAFFETVPDENSTKKALVTRRCFDSLLIRVDEGETLRELSSRGGQTTMGIIRSAFSGEKLAHSYADGRPGLDAHNYRMAVLVAIQTALAKFLLDDVEAGTPQRFAFFTGSAPSMPDMKDRPPHPGPLRWRPPSFLDRGMEERVDMAAGLRRVFIGVDPAIWQELGEARHRRVKVGGDPLDSHRGLVRLQVAALLAILDERVDVTSEDWRLAGMVSDTSVAVRTWLLAQVAEGARKEEAGRSAMLAGRAGAAAISKAGAETGIVRVAQLMERHVRKHPAGEVCAPRCLRRAVASRDRNLADAAFGHALVCGWITDGDDGYLPGPSMPA